MIIKCLLQNKNVHHTIYRAQFNFILHCIEFAIFYYKISIGKEGLSQPYLDTNLSHNIYYA